MGRAGTYRTIMAVAAVLAVCMLLPVQAAYASFSSNLGMGENSVSGEYFSADLCTETDGVYTPTSSATVISMPIYKDKSGTTISGEHTLSASGLYL